VDLDGCRYFCSPCERAWPLGIFHGGFRVRIASERDLPPRARRSGGSALEPTLLLTGSHEPEAQNRIMAAGGPSPARTPASGLVEAYRPDQQLRQNGDLSAGRRRRRRSGQEARSYPNHRVDCSFGVSCHAIAGWGSILTQLRGWAACGSSLKHRSISGSGVQYS
jgi:hypothetical protein